MHPVPPRGDTSGRTRRASLEQPRSRRSRAALVDAAERLWSERGFDAVKVSEICQEAGVSKGLFYFYFATKEDLLLDHLLADADAAAEVADRAIGAHQPIDQVLQQTLAVMVRNTGRRPRHLLARSIAEWFAALERHASLAIGHRPLHQTFARAFAHGRARGEIGDEHDPDELGRLLEWTLLRAELECAISTSRQPALLKRLWGWVEIILRGTKAA